MSASMACRSSFARLATPQALRLAAHQYSHLAATRSRWIQPASIILPRSSLEAAYYSSSSSSGQGPVASSSSLKLDANANERLLRDRPPAVIPEDPSASPSVPSSSKTASSSKQVGREVPGLSSDAASPQVAARPPKPPKLEKPKPKLVGRKAALSLVRPSCFLK